MGISLGERGMIVLLCIVLLLIAVLLVVFGLAILLSPVDEPVNLESRNPTKPYRWIVRPLRSDSRRLAAPAFILH
jgi:hypothetical protein